MFLLAMLDITLPIYHFLIMFTVGTGLTLADFRRVTAMPWTVVLATMTHMVCLPLSGLTVVKVFDLNQFVVVGVLLIAACPGGSLANVYVYLARANVALAVTLTGISSLVAIVTMPLVLLAFAHLLPATAGFQVPTAELLRFLGLVLLLPIVLGMGLRHLRPAFIGRHEQRLRLGALILLVALIVQVIWQAPEHFVADLDQTLIAGAAMAVLAVAAGMALGLLLRLDGGDFWTVSIRMMVQNVALATTIAVSVYRQSRFASFALAYVLIQMVIAAGLILVCLKRNRRSRSA